MMFKWILRTLAVAFVTWAVRTYLERRAEQRALSA
jgi:hypothetical protein